MARIPEADLEYDEESGGYFHQGAPFTGTAFTLHPGGEVESETEYADGFSNGPSRSWAADGKLESEHFYAGGALHGTAKTWHDNGQLAEDEVHEFGILISRKAYAEDGKLEEEFELPESDARWESIRRMREAEGGQSS